MKWPTVTIGDYLVRSELRDPTKNPRASFHYVDVSSVDNTTFAIRESTELIGADAPSRARKVIRNRDVIFATVRPTLRRIALVDDSLDNQICSTGFCVLRAGPKLDAGFLYYWLLTDDIVEHVAKIEKGVSYPAIRDSDVKAIRMPYPPPDEQRQIAAVLSAVQQAIERQERLIALTAELKKALMHKLFTEGTRGEPRKQTEIGPVPQSWEPTPLQTLFAREPSNGLYLPQTKYGRGTLILRIDDFSNDGDTVRCATKRVEASNDYHQRFGLSKGDIVVNRVNSLSHLGKTALIADLPEPMLFESNMMRFRVNEMQIRPAFAFRVLNSTIGKSQIISAAKRAVAQSSVNQGDVGRLLIPLPPTVEEQDAILSVIESAEAKQANHVQAHSSYSTLFRTLLHQLMTAQIRVHELNLAPLNGTGQPAPSRQQSMEVSHA